MKRILFAIPLAYAEGGFWTRDSGLVVLALREKGLDAWLVALDTYGKDPGGRPVILVTPDDLHNPAWWRKQAPDAVVLNTWSAPRYDGVRKAALAATPRVVERLDTDGVRSARLLPRLYLIRAWCVWCQRVEKTRLRWPAAPLSLAETAVRYLRGSFYDTRMAGTMKQLPGLIAESPVAAERIRQLLAASLGPEPRLVVIPHPVNDPDIRYLGLPRENRIITVGRWDAAQKDFPKVYRVLRDFLRRHPDWTATIVGGDVPAWARSGRKSGDEVAGRMIFHDRLDHHELNLEYNRSKIYLMASRYESFCIAAAEALCCGCSVVSSSEIATASYFAETDSGQVAATRKDRDFARALEAEVAAWSANRRDSGWIARAWKERAGSHEVARQTLAFLEGLPAVQRASVAAT